LRIEAPAGDGISFAVDILKEQTLEATLEYLHRSLQTLHQCNLALIRAKEEQELLESICRILVDFGGFQMAWVGYREDDARKSVRPVAYAGFEDGYLEEAQITWSETERGWGPTGTAIRTGRPSWIRNIESEERFLPWQRGALNRGYASCLALPLATAGNVFGTLSLYSSEAETFSEDTFRRYVELADNLAYGIAALRTQQQRLQAEEALRRSESYLAEGQRLTKTGSWAWDAVRQENIYWSKEHFRIFGLDPQKDTSSYLGAFQRIHPEDQARFAEVVKNAVEQNVDFEIEFRILQPDGSTKYARGIGHPVVDEAGVVKEMVGTTVDITQEKLAEAALQKAFEEIKALKDRLYEENLALREEVDQASMFEEIIGTSAALRDVLSRVAKVAPSDSTVLITGETGTGKELIARAIHKRSPRSSKAFISVNCAAIPSSLIASELFGHEKGAFTGALQKRIGRFELAEGGTIFLDEIGELPGETQVALLRVLQEREFERIGGNRPISANVRVIAATNRDLESAVANGEFRADLFYRLNVFPIELPPLRERKEDIRLLVAYFVDRYAEKLGRKIDSIEKKTLELFNAYPWPGNIRELQNVVERSLILCDRGVFSVDENWLRANASPAAEQATTPLVEKLHHQERDLIEKALASSRGRVAGSGGAAAKLGVPASTLESRIRALRIDKGRFRQL
jgi:PAS domain S-box-containing protein